MIARRSAKMTASPPRSASRVSLIIIAPGNGHGLYFFARMGEAGGRASFALENRPRCARKPATRAQANVEKPHGINSFHRWMPPARAQEPLIENSHHMVIPAPISVDQSRRK